MPTEFADFVIGSKSSGALIVSRKIALEIVIDELILVWAATTAEEWINRIAKIPL